MERQVAEITPEMCGAICHWMGEVPSQAWGPSDLCHVPRGVRTHRDRADGALHGRCPPSPEPSGIQGRGLL
jgi:hypothetical protein